MSEKTYQELVNLYARFFAGEAKFSDDLELTQIANFWQRVYEKEKDKSFTEGQIKANEAVLHVMLLKELIQGVCE